MAAPTTPITPSTPPPRDRGPTTARSVEPVGGPGTARRVAAQRRELARFLRSARERVKPQELGLLVGARRRAPGLLREEVAQLAAISCSWYSWLEQGRSVQVSEHVLHAVVRALRLSEAERDHVFRLAQHIPPGETVERDPHGGAAERDTDDGGLRRMLHQLHEAPAYLVDRRWNILEWNEAATALFGAPLDDVPPAERNALRFALLGRGLPLRFVDPVSAAHAHIAQFRADTTDLIGVPGFEEQIETLARDSALFRRLWPCHEVRRRPAEALRYQHSTLGRLRFEFVSTLAGDGSTSRLHAFLPCVP